MANKAILYDATKCTACRGCQAACKQWNEREGVETTNQGSYENPKDLSTQTWLKMKFNEVEKANGDVDWLFSRRSCMHCTHAACVEVCPTHALYHHPDGFVSYARDKCTGCGYCFQFCPFDVPRLNSDRLTGFGLMDKCTFCTTKGLDRISIGQEPACVKSCPPKALVYGNREDLLVTARAKVAALQADGHPNAVLYGEEELDGLHVLYVLGDSPDKYGLPQNPKFPAAATAWKDVLQPIGWVAIGAVAAGLGLNYLVARARRIREEENTHAKSK